MRFNLTSAGKLTFIAVLFGSFMALSSCNKNLMNATQAHNMSNSQFNRLKTLTTVLVLPESEYPYLEDYKQLVPMAWTLTPIEVIKYSDIEKYSDASKYALFNMKVLRVTQNPGSIKSSYSNTYYYLTLSTFAVNEKRRNKVKAENFGRIDLYPDFKTLSRIAKDDTEKLYKDASIRNFTLPYMLAYLRLFQQNVLNKNSPTFTNDYTHKEQRKRLATDTLYIPENVAYNRSGLTGKESLKDESFYTSYKGPYKILSTPDLIEILKNRDLKKPFYLFEYVLSSSTKFISVLDVSSGTIVYRRVVAGTYNLKTKDIERILP